MQQHCSYTLLPFCLVVTSSLKAAEFHLCAMPLTDSSILGLFVTSSLKAAQPLRVLLRLDGWNLLGLLGHTRVDEGAKTKNHRR